MKRPAPPLVALPLALALSAGPVAAGDKGLEHKLSEIYERAIELNAPVKEKGLEEEARASLQRLVDEQVAHPARFNDGPIKYTITATGHDEETGATYVLTLTADSNRKKADIREREPRWQPVMLDIYLAGNDPSNGVFDARIIDYWPVGLDFEERRYAGSTVSDAVWADDRVFNAFQPPRHESTIDFLVANYRKGVEEVLEEVAASGEQRARIIATNKDCVRNEVALAKKLSAEEELGSIEDSFPYTIEK